MLQLAKKGVSNTYRLTDAVRSGQISITKNPAVLEGDGPPLRIEAQSLHGPFTVLVDGQPMAWATVHEGRLMQDYTVAHPGGQLELLKRTGGLKPYDVESGGVPVGQVSIGRLTGRKVSVEVPDTVPFEARLLLGWLAVRQWARAANSGIAQ